MRIRNLFNATLLVIVFTGFFSGQIQAFDTTNRLVIKYKDNSSIRTSQSLNTRRIISNGGKVSYSHSLSDNRAVLKLPHEMSMEEAQRVADELSNDSDVLYAYPDKRVYPAFVPNDPDYISQWNLFEGNDGFVDSNGNVIQTYGINVQEAWDITTGSNNVVVAVLDSGIIAHSDINPVRVLQGYDFISDVDAGNDSQPGRDADPSDTGTAVAADECAMGEPAEDSSWHGLLVSSIIMAESDNSNYISGIDFSARLLPVRALGKCGGFVSDINDAVRWAAGEHIDGVPDNPNPAQVINLSFSGDGLCSQHEQAAINAAVLKGAVVIAAAGNGEGNANAISPGNCQNVITVGASRRDGGRAIYSNTGAVVDISAPGGDSTGNLVALTNNGLNAPDQDSFANVRGTSFSTAQVAAAASLLLAANSSLTPGQIETALMATAREFPTSEPVSCPTGMSPPCTTNIPAPCTVDTCGAGVMNVRAALELVTDPNAVIPDDYEPVIITLGGGGGGCSINQEMRFDIFWLLFLGLSLIKLRKLYKPCL